MEKEFMVSMPFTGVAVLTVRAESKAEAIAKFWEQATFPNTRPCHDTDVDVPALEFCEAVTTGNVFHGVQNKVDVTEI